MIRKVEKLTIAIVFSPFLGAAIGTEMQLAMSGFFSQPSTFASLLDANLSIVSYVGCLLGIPATIVIGLPAHAALYSLALRRGWHYAVTGVAPGMAVGALVLLLLSDAPEDVANLAPMLVGGAVTGAATAWTFWLIRRPDRDTPNPPTPAP